MAPMAFAEVAMPATGDPPVEEFEALVSSERDVEFGHARTPRLPELRSEHPCAAVTRSGGKIGLGLMALSLVLVIYNSGWQLPFFRPRSMVGLEEAVCLEDEELYNGICYMKCSILTNGNAPYRQSASECCKDNNFFCLFMGNTESPYFGMGGGQSPLTTVAHAPKVGGICDADGEGSEESFNGLCYKKCSVLTDGKYPVRVNPTACCGGGTLECLSGKGNVSLNVEFGAGVHGPGEEKSEMTARSKMSMLCLPNEEEYLGNCYQKCSQLTEGKATKRVSAEGCCTCTPGPFDALCCLWPFNVQTQTAYNVGLDYYGKTAPPHPPGFSVRCSDSEEVYNSLCYKKCTDLTDGRLPHRQGPTKCCQSQATNSTGTCADSPVLSKGGEKSSGAVHGPYIRPHAARTPPTPPGGHKFRGISGGERRRAAVGVELAVARGVLALDEPTSGLDSSSALALGSLLAELAAEGVILLASMHQPSPDLLAYFSSTLVLGAHGRVAYFGPSEQLPTYVSPFRKLNPGVSSASDLLLDVISGPHRDKVFEGFHETKHANDLQEDIQRVLMMASEDDMEVKSAAMPPVWVQLRQLLLRELQISRSLAAYTYFEATIAGALLGVTYYQMSDRLAGVISRLGLIFAVHCTLGMQALQGLLAWRDGYTSYRRERAAGYYYTGSFVIAKVVVDAILLRVGPPALMCMIVYLLASMHPGREAVCCLGFCLASFVSSTFCLALGATAPRSGVVLPLAVLLILIFLLFGGPLLASGDDVFRNISIFRASFNMVAANELRGLDFVFDPEGVVTTLGSRSGEDWMTDLGIKDNPIGEEVGWLLGWSFFYILVAWAVLAARSVTSSDYSLLSLFRGSGNAIQPQGKQLGRRRSTASE